MVSQVLCSSGRAIFTAHKNSGSIVPPVAYASWGTISSDTSLVSLTPAMIKENTMVRIEDSRNDGNLHTSEKPCCVYVSGSLSVSIMSFVSVPITRINNADP